MEKLCIRMFGKFEVCCGSRQVDGFEAHKLQELLSYLLLHREQPHARETVASVLWSESTIGQSKKHLRQALWQLQGLLEPCAEQTGGPLLLVEPEWVGLDPGVTYWLDVAAFEQLTGPLQETPGRALEGGEAEALQEAISIYRADLLEGFYDDWCLFERERLQNIYLAVLDKLMVYHEARGAYRAGLACGTRILRYDRASERTHRRLMRMHYRAGDRTAALRQYQRCVAALREELDVAPGERTQKLDRQVRDDTFGRSPSDSTQERREPDTASSLSQLLWRYEQLQASLADLHRQVQEEIQAMELALAEQTPSTQPQAEITPQ
jgi:DNA-binding SARP family transcriptional activator